MNVAAVIRPSVLRAKPEEKIDIQSISVVGVSGRRRRAGFSAGACNSSRVTTI
jgi:hypothetical protein